ncbi:MAG: hypothetical protein J0I47_01270 [Sphingomonas sp.]|uniref:hypothetical protein n=1 Tax=Sphingomonas sp. TaxID=28214 RepID=UPI001ACF4C49|nr:hypothetical protein [Sphingomonas sp.]MBN8806859.1 hypothetical protein [Sphingomonas sp.]
MKIALSPLVVVIARDVVSSHDRLLDGSWGPATATGQSARAGGASVGGETGR